MYYWKEEPVLKTKKGSAMRDNSEDSNGNLQPSQEKILYYYYILPTAKKSSAMRDNDIGCGKPRNIMD